MKKIVIDKFRSIEHIELDLEPLTILVGKNNTGKSNIVDAIKIALDEASPFEKGKDGCNFEKPSKDEFQVEISFNDGSSKQIPKGTTKKARTISTDNYDFLYISAELDVKDPQTSKEVKTELEKIFELTKNALVETESQLQTQLNEILNDGLIKEALSAINENLNDWDGINLKISPKEPALKKMMDYYGVEISEKNKFVDASSLGSGLKRSIIAAILHGYAKVKTGENTRKLILLFEEPELYLHPWQLKQLRQDLRALADNGHIIIATSHSPQFVSPESLEEWSSIIRVSKDDGFTGVHKLNPVTSKSFENPESMEFNPIKYMLMLDKERAQLFFSDKLIIVEGWSDKALLEKLVLEGKIKGGNFYVLETMGKSNIVNFVNILDPLGSKFLIFYDTDDQTSKNKQYNSGIDDLGSNENIEVYKFPTELEKELMSEEDFNAYKEASNKNNRRDLKPARLLQYYDEGKLKTEELQKIIDKCNAFLNTL